MQKVISKKAVVPDRLALLVLIWSAGISLGLIFGDSDPGVLPDCLMTTLSAPVTIGVLLSSLPLIIGLLLLRFSLQYLIFPLLFLKAFFDGFLMMTASVAFGSALWIIYWPLFFSERCINFWFLWLSSCIPNREGDSRRFLLITIAVLVDFFLVSPWLHRLMIQI